MNCCFEKQHHYKITIIPIKNKEITSEKLVWIGLRSNNLKLTKLKNIPNEIQIDEKSLFTLVNKSREVEAKGNQSRVMSPIDKNAFKSIKFNSDDTKVISNLLSKLSKIDYDEAVKMVTELDSETLYMEKREIIASEQAKTKSSIIKPIPKRPTIKIGDSEKMPQGTDSSGNVDLKQTPKVRPKVIDEKTTQVRTDISSTKIEQVVGEKNADEIKKDKDIKIMEQKTISVTKEKPIMTRININKQVNIKAKNIEWDDEERMIMISTNSIISLDYEKPKHVEIFDKLFGICDPSDETNKKIENNSIEESTQTIIQTSDESTQIDANSFKKFGNRRPAFFNGQSVGLFERHVGVMGLTRYTIKHLESTTEIPALSFRIDLPKLVKAFKSKNPSLIYQSCASMTRIDRDKYLNRSD